MPEYRDISSQSEPVRILPFVRFEDAGTQFDQTLSNEANGQENKLEQMTIDEAREVIHTQEQFIKQLEAKIV